MGDGLYESPAIAGSGSIACGLAATASAISKTLLLARSDASAWKAEEQAHSLCAKVEDGDASRLKVTTDPEDLAGCDLVVEAIVEDLGTKVELLKTLAKPSRTPTWRPRPRRSGSPSSATGSAPPSGPSACTRSTRWCGWS